MAHIAKIKKVFFMSEGVIYPLKGNIIQVRKEDAKEAVKLENCDTNDSIKVTNHKKSQKCKKSKL